MQDSEKEVKKIEEEMLKLIRSKAPDLISLFKTNQDGGGGHQSPQGLGAITEEVTEDDNTEDDDDDEDDLEQDDLELEEDLEDFDDDEDDNTDDKNYNIEDDDRYVSIAILSTFRANGHM